MAQGRISRKDAVAFGYLSQLMLQTVSGVRAEYVAAFGYRQWENKLKSSLGRVREDDPPPSPENPGDEPDGVILSESGPADERRISPNVPQERPLAERIMGKPDYADILSRSLDMLDRKYDTTPEGRSEANKLALELELMKPAPAKPAKDFFGQTVDLMRRFRDAEERRAAGDPEPSSLPPEAFLNYYGHPTKLAVPPAGGTATPGCEHPNPYASRSEPPTVPDPATCNSAPVEAGSAPHSELPLPVPTSATPAKHDSLGGPDADHHEGHRTDWYAPPSWSKIRLPDPCPSRKEKLRRKIRGMTNSAFRRLQHQNSRGFWNKALQKLTP